MAPDPELRALVDRLLAGNDFGRVDTSRLEERLKEPAALRYYTEVMAQEAMMAEALEGISGGTAKRRFRLARTLRVAAVLALFALGFLAGRGSFTRPPELADSRPDLRSGARLTGLMGVDWNESEGPATTFLDADERVSFRSGLVELTYSNGVRVTLEGPADFTVAGATSGRLDAGKLVAFVPPGAEGFTIDYAEGRIVDLGTEFAMDVAPDRVEIGVFDGEIELHLPGDSPRPLLRNQAVVHDSAGPSSSLRAVPLDREKFVRRLPARDFRWELVSDEPKELVFDVTHLIWKPARYRALFKWVDGMDAIIIDRVELRLDGRTVAADHHEGVTGILRLVRGNLYELDLPAAEFARGRWTLHATARPHPRELVLRNRPDPVMSQGILQFEEGLVSKARDEDFVGRWSYHHLGSHFVREIHPDGRLSLTRDGRPVAESFVGERWAVEDGVLSIWVPHAESYERHVLRDPETLIFISNPYSNAVRLGDR